MIDSIRRVALLLLLFSILTFGAGYVALDSSVCGGFLNCTAAAFMANLDFHTAVSTPAQIPPSNFDIPLFAKTAATAGAYLFVSSLLLLMILEITKPYLVHFLYRKTSA
jgi:hypothetical protein